MLNLITNNAKILSNQDKPTIIGYDTRIYTEYNSIHAACIFKKIQEIYGRYGEFGIKDEKFSKLLGMTLITFKRAKNVLKNRLETKIGKGNKTYYSIKNDLPYDPESYSYRSFDFNNLYIMDNNLKGAAFLGQLLYWWKKELIKGNLEFSKTDNQIINDLPFLSQCILTSLKKIAVIKGFITIVRRSTGKDWGISHYTVHPNIIEKAIKNLNCEHHGSNLNDLISQRTLVCIKIETMSVSKSRLCLYQNRDSTISNTIYPSILSSAGDQKGFDRNSYEVEKKERNELKKDKVEQPFLNDPNPKEGNEIYSMIGTWKEIVSSHETINLSSRLKDALSAALKNKFDNSLDKWKSYCENISSNEWLMGKNDRGWKVQLSWAIKFESIDKVICGAIYCKKKHTSYKTDQKPIVVPLNELIEEVMLSNDDPDIKKVKLGLINEMSQSHKGVGLTSYHTYFRRAIFETSREGSQKKLIIKSSYGAFNCLLSYHDVIAKACADFEEITIYGGTNDRSGNKIFMRETPNKKIEVSEEEERLSVQEAITGLLYSCRGQEGYNVPEKTCDLMK
jgi:hypothetical protein